MNFAFTRFASRPSCPRVPTGVCVAAALVFLLPNLVPAQTSQFLFDDNGNLTVQTSASTTPPQILGQPQNVLVAVGEPAALSVVVADPVALTYQWRFNGADLGGATSEALILQNVSTNNEGFYQVVLANPSGSVTSAPAFLWIDNDGDGMADSWERAFFGTLVQLPNADADGDGASNLQEFLDGTNPTNAASVLFHITVIRDGGSVGIVPDLPGYTNGQTVTLTAIGSSNQPFHAWFGDILTRSNPVTLVMTNNKTVDARFSTIGFVWTNQASGDWNVATNWRPNLAPGSNDTVVINSSVTVTLNTPADCLDLTLGGVGAPTLTGSGTLTIRGNFFWTAGTMSGTGRTILETGARLMDSSLSTVSLPLINRTLENGGTVLWTGSGIIEMTTAAITNRAGALFHVQTAAPLLLFGVNRFDNAGTFRKSVSTGVMTVPTFNNSGAVELQAGTLRLASGGTATGTFDAPATTSVEWIGGTFTLNAGAQLNGAGLYRLNGGSVIANTNLTFEALDLISSSSTLNVTGAVTIASGMNWTAGTMSGSGRTIIETNATLNLDSSSSLVFLSTRTLENGGTVLWTGAGALTLTSGVITNRLGALFHAQNAAPLSLNGAGISRFDNAGTFRKSVSIGTTTFGVSFNNPGTVELQSGTLHCNGGFTNNGGVILSAGTTNRLAGGGSATGTSFAPAPALVEWTGGTFTLNPGAQLNGTGPYRLNGGNVTANLDLAVENLDLVSAFSTLSGTSTVSVATLMNWTAGTMGGGGRTVIGSGGVMNLGSSSAVSLSSRTVENGGTVLWTGSGGIGLGPGVITNRPGALFHAQNAAQFQAAVGVNRFDNAGTFRKSISTGTTTVQSGVSLNNFGTVELQSGTLQCNGNFTNNGAVTLSAVTTNRLANGGSATGKFSAPATALVEWTSGTFTLNSGAQLNGSGLYRLNGGNVTANLDLAVENLDLVSAFSTLSGTSTVSVATSMNWTAGIMSGGGRTIIGLGAVMNLGSSSSPSLSSRTVENAGTVLWTGSGGVVLAPGVITNRPGALFHAQNAAQISLGFSSGRFDNAGTFRKSVSTGTTSIGSGVGFTNYGTVDIRSSVLAVNGGYVSASNAFLNCALGGIVAGTSYGQLQVAGTVTLNGGLSVDLLPGFSPATNDIFTVVSAGTRSSAFASFSYPSNRVTMELSNAPNAVVLHVTNVFPVPQPVLFMPELAGTNAKLTWTAISNVTYRLEANPDLASSNWAPVPGDVTTLSNTASKLDPLTPSNRLYRVHILP
jgi:hypothetical protein